MLKACSLILWTVIVSCAQNERKATFLPGKNGPKNTIKMEEAGAGDNILMSIRDSVNHEEFTVLYTQSWSLYVLSSNGDSINIDEKTGIQDMEFQDFDKDGFKDIRIYYMTNVPGVENLLLYNEETGSFTPV